MREGLTLSGWLLFLFSWRTIAFPHQKSLVHMTVRDSPRFYILNTPQSRCSFMLLNRLPALLQILHRLIVIPAGNSQI